MFGSTHPKPQANPLPADARLTGTVHIFVAFDWGDEVDLEATRTLLNAQRKELPRRRRTPSSFNYTPRPLQFPLEAIALRHAEPTGSSQSLVASADVTLFDFGGASVALRLPIEMTGAELCQFAGQLADSEWLVERATAATAELFEQLRPAIQQPHFSPLTEEYIVFQLVPGDPLPLPPALIADSAAWVAALVRLETEPLSGEQIAAALQSHITYNPYDLFVPEWSAALLIDRDCEETLQTIEFANLQLLEFRFIDRLLDDRLADAYRLIHPLTRRLLPFWRTHAQPLRALGELRIHANSLFERTGNTLKLVGDQYLARVYRLLATRFHLDQWEQSIQRSLEVVESVYRVLADQAASYRTESLEIIVIVLIAFELVMAIVRH